MSGTTITYHRRRDGRRIHRPDLRAARGASHHLDAPLGATTSGSGRHPTASASPLPVASWSPCLVRTGTRRHLRACRVPLHLGPGARRLGQHLLRRRREEWEPELAGLLLRLARPEIVHHRRQAPGRALGHGTLCPDLRVLQLEHAAAGGSCRRRIRHGAVPPRTTLVRRARRCPGVAGLHAHAGGRGRLPLQQPRRRPDPPARPRHVGLLARH